MGAITALSDTGGAIKRNPNLFAGALVIGVVGTFVQFGSNFIPILGLFIGFGYFFVEPLFAGGFLGMADEALSGKTTFGAFWTHGKDNYVDLLVARLVVGVVAGVCLFVFAFVFAFAVPMGGGLGQPTGDVGTAPGAAPATSNLPVVALVLFAVVGLVALVAVLMLQFYPAAIVVGDADPLESFKYSVLVFKEHPLSVIGYSILSAVLGFVLLVAVVAGLFAALGGIGALLPTGTGSEAGGAGLVLGVIVAVLVVVTVLRTIQVGVLRTYYVAFVRSVAS